MSTLTTRLAAPRRTDLSNAQSAPSRLRRSRGQKALQKATNELFRTPWDVWAAFIQHFPHLVRGDVLDPAAGHGEFTNWLTLSGNLGSHRICDVRAAEQTYWARTGLTDLLGPGECRTAEFLAAPIDRQFDNVVTNPPFSLAQEFVERGLEWVRPGGYVTVLQATGWLSGQDRGAWFLRQPFAAHIVIPYRPVFSLHKPANEAMPEDPYRQFTFAYGFSLFCFQKGYRGPPAPTYWLPDLF